MENTLEMLTAMQATSYATLAAAQFGTQIEDQLQIDRGDLMLATQMYANLTQIGFNLDVLQKTANDISARNINLEALIQSDQEDSTNQLTQRQFETVQDIYFTNLLSMYEGPEGLSNYLDLFEEAITTQRTLAENQRPEMLEKVNAIHNSFRNTLYTQVAQVYGFLPEKHAKLIGYQDAA